MARARKTKPDVPGASAKPPVSRAKAGHNSGDKGGLSDADQQRLFLQDRDKYIEALDLKKKYDKAFKDACKKITANGHTVDQIKFAIQLATPEGEKAARAIIQQSLWAARMVNSPMGHQAALFDEPDRTPSVDRAYDEGKLLSAENKPCHCPYDPSVPQYASFLQGYHDHQRELAGGFKATGPRAADADADAEQQESSAATTEAESETEGRATAH